MRVYRSSYRDRKGQPQKTKSWYVEFRDHNGDTRRIPAFTSKSASEEFGRSIDRLVAYRTATGGQTDPVLQRWIDEIPATARQRLAKIGLIDSERVAANKRLDAHVDDYESALRSKGNTDRHAKLTTARVRKVFEGCGFRYYSDITASKVQSSLNDLRRGESGISIQTFNYYLGAIKAFCRWMVRDGRATRSPVAHLQKLNAQADCRRQRRALSHDELRWLLDCTESQPVRGGIPGGDRALLYRLACETGLRLAEIRSLTRESFDLSADPSIVTVAAAYSKRRREDTLPLRPATARSLERIVQRSRKGGHIFALSAPTRMAGVLRADLSAAREAWILKAESPEQRSQRLESDFLRDVDAKGHVVDFHALRHTFITNLATGGVHPKTAQVLARHSTITLTMDRYSHSERGAELAALNTLPDLPEPKPAQRTPEPVEAESVLASCWARNERPAQIDGDRERLNSDDQEASLNPVRTTGNADSDQWARRDSNPHWGCPQADFKSAASAVPPRVLRAE